MLRLIIGLLFLASCSSGGVKTGGNAVYTYDPVKEYTSDELKVLAPEVVTTSMLDPHVGKLNELFSNKQAPLKKIGIVIFESQIQPTRSGLAGLNKVYLSEPGKQLLTEKLLNVWEQVFKTLTPEIDYVSNFKVRKAKSASLHGMNVDDAINSKREALEPDDIFYLESGKHTTTATVLNPRGMRDLSLLLVPATELMMGPRWTEYQKHYVNEMARELKLDAVIIVMSELSWTAAHTDKHSGEHFADSIHLKLTSSTLVSLSDYRKRAENLGMQDAPSINLPYRTYESKVSLPATISVPPEGEHFDTIVKKILRPMLKSYIDLTIMTVHQMTEDLKKTY